MEEKAIGKVVHYFKKISVGTIKLTDTLVVGDTIHVKGAHDDFTQPVESIHVQFQSAQEAHAGDEAGVKMTNPAHENDVVYKVS